MDKEKVGSGWMRSDAVEVKSAWLTVLLQAGDARTAVTVKMPV